jgi:hypothetical protein
MAEVRKIGRFVVMARSFRASRHGATPHCPQSKTGRLVGSPLFAWVLSKLCQQDERVDALHGCMDIERMVGLLKVTTRL